MSRSQPPPGGPLNPEFRDAIDELAKQAREEDQRADAEAKKRLAKRPFAKFVRIGLILIVLQAALFAYLYNRDRGRIYRKPVATTPLFPERSCNAVAYHTYWKIVAYLKDEGHPPASFDEMLGKYLDKLPADPLSGAPLTYSTDGTHFEIHCPGSTPPKR